MIKNKTLVVSLAGIMLIVGACGSMADPVPNEATRTAEEAQAVSEDDEEEAAVVAQEPTATTLPPTATPTLIPPTVTPTMAPPTAAPAEPAAPELSPEEENIIFFIQDFSDPVAGEALWNANYEVEMQDGTIGEWACSTCHLYDSDMAGTGPGMLGLPDRAGERVPGEPAELYTYNSIIHPNDYIVEGYNAGVMPVGYEAIFSEQDLYNLTAYLLAPRDG